MKRSPVRSRSWAFTPWRVSALAETGRALDEPQAARHTGVDARQDQAAGEDAAAHGPDQPRTGRSLGDQRATAVALARGCAEGEATRGPEDALPQRADHRLLLEAAGLSVCPVAAAGPVDALLGRLQAAGHVGAPGAAVAPAGGAHDPAGTRRCFRLSPA